MKDAWPRPVGMLYYVSSWGSTLWINPCLSVSLWSVCLSQSLSSLLSHSELKHMNQWGLQPVGHHVHWKVSGKVRASALTLSPLHHYYSMYRVLDFGGDVCYDTCIRWETSHASLQLMLQHVTNAWQTSSSLLWCIHWDQRRDAEGSNPFSMSRPSGLTIHLIN